MEVHGRLWFLHGSCVSEFASKHLVVELASLLDSRANTRGKELDKERRRVGEVGKETNWNLLAPRSVSHPPRLTLAPAGDGCCFHL